jgi:riboflavin synthase
VFTGIVKEIGAVDAVDRGEDGARLRVSAQLAGELEPGDSVAVNGACLTVVGSFGGAFEAEVMNQTLTLTTLAEAVPGAKVNLEPPLRAGDPLGGHLVQGHVDGTGQVESAEDDGFARRVEVAVPQELRRFVVERGSIAVDGVSLTVAGLSDAGFQVSLIPETLQRTTLGGMGEGGRVNLEVDVIARYAERLVQGFKTEGSVTR